MSTVTSLTLKDQLIIFQNIDSIIANKATSKLKDGCSLDDLAIGPDDQYSTIAGRLLALEIVKGCSTKSFTEYIKKYQSLFTQKFLSTVQQHQNNLNGLCDEMLSINYTFNWFAINTLKETYLLNSDETPVYMYMRIAVATSNGDLNLIIKTFKLLCCKLFNFASPIIFNAGLKNGQLASCFLLPIKNDSIEGIFDTLKDCAIISKKAGGIGLSIGNVRGENAKIGASGISKGLIPFLRILNETMNACNQQGKRKGSCAIYLQPDHIDFPNFIELRKNRGDEHMRCKDLFLGVYISDWFMKKVVENKEWYMFCPSEYPGLDAVYGQEYVSLYEQFVQKAKSNNDSKHCKVTNATSLFETICNQAIETGGVYIVNKDQSNIKSNHKNLGTIKCSNLCTEILQYSSPTETAVCNLCSLSLNSEYYYDKNKNFLWNTLAEVVRHCVVVMNNIIDMNYYPTPEAKNSNMMHRPIAIGISGFHDALFEQSLCFDSDGAKEFNKKLFASIYYHALSQSNLLAQIQKDAYSSFRGSDFSKGILQFDYWPKELQGKVHDSFDWTSLKLSIQKYGTVNSLLTACMPTASSAIITKSSPCIEPYESNLYLRKVKAGTYIILNKYLVRSLKKLDLWNRNMYYKIYEERGSIQNIQSIPDNIKKLYRTAYEMSQQTLLELNRDRGLYLDQTSSLNLFLPQPTTAQVSSMFYNGWKMGLKTICYYTKAKPKVETAQFNIGLGVGLTDVGEDVEQLVKLKTSNESPKLKACKLDSECISCSS